jgi:hypothetical protein
MYDRASDDSTAAPSQIPNPPRTKLNGGRLVIESRNTGALRLLVLANTSTHQLTINSLAFDVRDARRTHRRDCAALLGLGPDSPKIRFRYGGCVLSHAGQREERPSESRPFVYRPTASPSESSAPSWVRMRECRSATWRFRPPTRPQSEDAEVILRSSAMTVATRGFRVGVGRTMTEVRYVCKPKLPASRRRRPLQAASGQGHAQVARGPRPRPQCWSWANSYSDARHHPGRRRVCLCGVLDRLADSFGDSVGRHGGRSPAAGRKEKGRARRGG